MAVNFRKNFHFCSPDGTQAITLEPDVPRKVSPVMAAQFASFIAKGDVDGSVTGTTIVLHGETPKAPEPVVEKVVEEVEEDIQEIEPEPVETTVAVAPELPVVEKENKTREEVIQEGVNALLALGAKEFLTEMNEPRMSALRKITFSDLSIEERDAALNKNQSE